jgi:hypothetical protein
VQITIKSVLKTRSDEAKTLTFITAGCRTRTSPRIGRYYGLIRCDDVVLSPVTFQFLNVTSSAPALTAETRDLTLTGTLKLSVQDDTRQSLFVYPPKVDSSWLSGTEASTRSAEDRKPPVEAVISIFGFSDQYRSWPFRSLPRVVDIWQL